MASKEIKIVLKAHADEFIKGINTARDSENYLLKSTNTLASEFLKAEKKAREFQKQVSKSQDYEGYEKLNSQVKNLSTILSQAKNRIDSWSSSIGDQEGEVEALKYKYSELLKLLEKVNTAGKTGEGGRAIADSGLQEELDQTKARLEELGVTMKTSTETGAQGFKKIGDEVKAQQSKVLKFGEIFKNIFKFQLIMRPLQAVMNGVTNFLKDCPKVAGEAEQVFSKLETVFNNQSKALAVATTNASKYGVALSTMASSLSTVGDLLQAQGMTKAESLNLSADWVGKFQDIIAFKDINMSLDEFASNFMSGASGNLKNFRSFGSIVKESNVNARLLKEGLSDLQGEELELAKMTTRANMALEQQANAIGATQREWNTTQSVNRRLSESTKTLKENIGQNINEVINPIKNVLTEILTTINDQSKIQSNIKNNIEAMALDKKDNTAYASMLASAVEAVFKANGLSNSYDYDKLQASILSVAKASGVYAVDLIEALKVKLDGTNFAIYGNNLGGLSNAQRLDKMKSSVETADFQAKQRSAIESNTKVLLEAIDNAKIDLTGIQDYNAGLNIKDYLKGNFADQSSWQYLTGRADTSYEGNLDNALKSLITLLTNTSEQIKEKTKARDDLINVKNTGLNNIVKQGAVDSANETIKLLDNELTSLNSKFKEIGDTIEETNRQIAIKALDDNLKESLSTTNKNNERLNAEYLSVKNGEDFDENLYNINITLSALEDEYKACGLIQEDVTTKLSEYSNALMEGYNLQNEINKESERQKNTKSFQTALSYNYSDITKTLNTNGSPEIVKSLYELAIEIKNIKDQYKVSDTNLTQDEYNSALNTYKGQKKFEIYTSETLSAQNKADENKNALGNIFTTEYGKQKEELDSYLEVVKNLITSTDDELESKNALIGAIIAEKDSLENLTMANSAISLGDTLTGGAISGITEIIASFSSGDIASGIASIIEQFECFKELIEPLTETMSILNKFIEPMAIALKPIIDMIMNNIIPLLKALSPILKVFATAIVFISTMIEISVNTISGLVLNAIKGVVVAVANILSLGLANISGGFRDWAYNDYVDIGKNQQEAQERMEGYIQRIWGGVDNIDKNTRDEDWDKIVDLYTRGFIHENEYQNLLGVHLYGMQEDKPSYGSLLTSPRGYDNSSVGSFIGQQTIVIQANGSDVYELMDLIKTAGEGGLSYGKVGRYNLNA